MIEYRGVLMFSIVLLIVFSMISITGSSSIVLGIVKRNDKSIPLEPIPSNTSALISNLEELRKLNDSVVNYYVDMIEKSLASGDYESANMLLSNLQRYLYSKYGNGTGNEELDKAISYVSSVKSIENDTVYLDLEEYLSKLAELTNSTDIAELADKLRNEGLLNESEINELSEILASITNTSRLLNFNPPSITSGGNPPINPPQPLSVPPAPALSLPYISEWIGPLMIAIIILTILYIYRGEISRYIKPFKTTMKRTLSILTARIRRINEPVALLLYEFLVLAEGLGYRRKRSETLREFLEHIRISELYDAGRRIIEVYESRYYGYKTIDYSLIARLRENLKKLPRMIR